MRYALVDYHCHLDLYPDFPTAVSECGLGGVETLTVTTTPKAWPRNRDLASSTRNVRAALGIHPQLVTERAHEIELFEEYLPEARFVGEVGLDAGPRFYRSLEAQEHVFGRVLTACARYGDKILTVHSIRAARAVLDLIHEHLPQNRGRVVLHWFTGSIADARRAVDLGCYFSINAAMLKSERNRKLCETIPLDRILTETDGPFTQVNGRPSVPSDVHDVVRKLAALRNLETESLADGILKNLRRLEGK